MSRYVKTRTGPTLAEAVLLACPDGAVSLNDLIVAAWERHPDCVGMAGYADRYPDSHKVAALLSGKGGPVRHGLLERVEPNVYRITEKGRLMVAKLTKRTVPEAKAASVPQATVPDPATGWTRAHDTGLMRLLELDAVYSWREGLLSELRPADRDAADQAFHAHEEALARAGNLPTPFLLRSGLEVSASDLGALRSVREWLEKRAPKRRTA